MNSITASAVTLQTSSESMPSPPSWLGEGALLVQHLRQPGVLSAIAQQGRFARRRLGRYEVIDFVAVLLGYALSSERTLEAFDARLHPFAAADHWPSLGGSPCLPARRSRAFWPR